MYTYIRHSPRWIGTIKPVSVVVDEFDIVRTSLSPNEADPPLRVHPDAVLPASIASQLLETVAGRDPKILDVLGRMDQLELPQGRTLQRSVDAFDVLLMPDAFGVLAAERPDHTTSL